MTNLTEQWKRRELETNKYYYVRDISYISPAKLGKYDNRLYFSGNGVGYGYEENKELEVLAEVPSYEEWKTAYECVVSENEEITTLKELLKRIKDYMPEYATPMTLLAEIDELLGEE